MRSDFAETLWRVENAGIAIWTVAVTLPFGSIKFTQLTIDRQASSGSTVIQTIPAAHNVRLPA